MKKILYVIGYPLKMTGSQKQIEQLIVNLPEGFLPTVLVATEAGVSAHFKAQGIPVKVISPQGALNSYGKKLLNIGLIEKAKILISDYWQYTKALKKYLDTEGFDLIHCNDGRAVVLIGLAQVLSRTKMISHMQGDRAFKYNIYWFLFELLPEKIVLNAKFIKNSLSILGKRKALTVYTGIAKPQVQAIESAWLRHQKEDRVIIGAFASVVPFKGFHHLIEAVRILVHEKKVNGFLCLLVGNFPEEYRYYQEWLFRLIQKYDIGNYIQFTGWTNAPGSYMDFCDITTLPSVLNEALNIEGKVYDVKGNEGFPTVHLEAMHLSKPIVGTSIAGVPEQIEEGVTGYVVAPQNTQNLANALATLIEDPSLRKKMGQAGYHKVHQDFALQNYVAQIVQLYNKLI
jgi:glycosyltransferase involved in cell wall biosynthesis